MESAQRRRCIPAAAVIPLSDLLAETGSSLIRVCSLCYGRGSSY